MMAVMTQSEVLLLMVQIGIGCRGNAGVGDGRRLSAATVAQLLSTSAITLTNKLRLSETVSVPVIN